MIRIGAQYYRPPFPNEKYWEEDLGRMADAGLNTVQLWVKWAWVEPAPGEFRFDDYDRLVEIADAKGLGVVMSTIAEIQPYWIHREVPGSEMIDSMGNAVISSNREECHYGLTPGGCTDNPGVWQHMARFLSEVVSRYRSAPNLRGWDAWNELRWCVNSDGLVCFCPHTLEKFRRWLDERHGGLGGLNEAWHRRYTAWEDVLPGKKARGPYTEMMAFEHFITWRASMHAKARYDLIKSVDAAHPVTVHGGEPSVLTGGWPEAGALHRGNDWDFADRLDGIGTSSFPVWGGMDHSDFIARIEFTRSAARGKRIWLSELQGGRAASGFTVHKPVVPAAQQRWLWTGLSRGADTILFWCWRDEVFGRESGGFGIVGADGFAEARVAALKKTAEVVRVNAGLLEGYRPDTPGVGVFFSPQTYYLHWIEEKGAGSAVRAVRGYARALVRGSIGFTVVEEAHLAALGGLKVLFLPRTLVVDEGAGSALSAFVRAGGTLVAESECGAFGSNGIWRYPEERFLAKLTGVREVGRRALTAQSIGVRVDGREMTLAVRQWLTPFESGRGEVLGASADGPVMVEVPVGKGRVILCGAYLGDAYFGGATGEAAEYAPFCGDFERFVAALAAKGGVAPGAEVIEPAPSQDSLVHVTTGMSGGRRVAFVFVEPESVSVRLRFRAGCFRGGVRDVISGSDVQFSDTARGQECALPPTEWGVAVLTDAG